MFYKSSYGTDLISIQIEFSREKYKLRIQNIESNDNFVIIYYYTLLYDSIDLHTNMYIFLIDSYHHDVFFGENEKSLAIVYIYVNN